MTVAKTAWLVGEACQQPVNRTLGAHRERSLLREQFELVEMSHQFIFRGPAHEVELDHLQGANGGLSPHPETDQEAGDDGQVDLDRDAVAAVGQQMTAT